MHIKKVCQLTIFAQSSAVYNGTQQEQWADFGYENITPVPLPARTQVNFFKRRSIYRWNFVICAFYVNQQIEVN